MINKSFEFKVGVIGLGYVGTPLACLFSKKYDTWGTTSMPTRWLNWPMG